MDLKKVRKITTEQDLEFSEQQKGELKVLELYGKIKDIQDQEIQNILHEYLQNSLSEKTVLTLYRHLLILFGNHRAN